MTTTITKKPRKQLEDVLAVFQDKNVDFHHTFGLNIAS